MGVPKFVDSAHQVSALQIDAPGLKDALAKIAVAIDNSFSRDDPSEVAKHFRDAFEELSTHVYLHCQDKLPDGGSAASANSRFDQFEKLCGLSQPALKALRDTFQARSNLASHGGISTQQQVEESFNKILRYAERWIVDLAPEGQRRLSAYKDQHLDEIASYRKRAQAKLTELMGNAPARCYLERKVRYRRFRNEEEYEPANDDPLGWRMAHHEKAERDAALPGTPATLELLQKTRCSWLLAQAGMGKSLEAVQLAVRLTCADGVAPLSCCVVVECRLLDKTEPSIETGFGAPVTVSPGFNVFCALRGWRRFLILDGFDEKLCAEEPFRDAVLAFMNDHQDIHVLITSRNVTAVATTFSWQAYELVEVDLIDALQYLVDRRGRDDPLLHEVADQFDALTEHDSICGLLKIPFFLNALAGNLEPGDQIRHIGRRELLERFILELLKRQKQKGTRGELTSDEHRCLLDALGRHAFCKVTGRDDPTPIVMMLAGLDLLLRPDDAQFRQAEIRDYLAARHLFGEPTDENFDLLHMLEDEQRFTLHGWLLELVNGEPLESKEKTAVRDRLWHDDPVLVSLGLFSETRLKSLALPERPWEPYEIGLLKIMRGEDAAAIPETIEIRDVRLCSPGEKLLHRLRHRDLPYLVRAVPNRRALAKLEATWTTAADPWAELMQPLAPLAQEWLGSRPGQSRLLRDFAYEVVEPRAMVDRVAAFAQAAVEDRVETEVLVRLLLLFADLRALVATEPKKKEKINDAIKALREEALDRLLTAKQLHRLIVSGTRHRDRATGISHDRVLAPKVMKLIYGGAVREVPQLESVRMKSLIMEIPGLSCFEDTTAAKSFAATLWAEILAHEDVTSVPPFTLAQALWTKIAILGAPDLENWLARWFAHWFDRLSPYEAVLLQKRGIQFDAEPPGLVNARGWLQARDAVDLERVRRKRRASPDSALQTHRYTPEQKRHWVKTAMLSELIGLLKDGVIDRSATDDVFKQAVRRLEEDSQPQHWWQLVRDGTLEQDDIHVTTRKLKAEVTSKPVAYELLQSAGWYDEPPSGRVVDLAARCVDCPLDTRVNLVRDGMVSIEVCWEAEMAYLNEVRRKIAAGDKVTGLNDLAVPDKKGGLLHGFYTLKCCRDSAGLNGISFYHPGFDSAIEFRDNQSRQEIANLAAREGWREGELIMGFLWVTPASDVAIPTFTVVRHKMGYHATGYVLRGDKPHLDPARTWV